MNITSRLLMGVIITLFLSSCQSNHEQANAHVVQQSTQQQLEKAVVDEEKDIEVKTEQVAEAQKTPTSVDLNVSEQFLQQIDDKREGDLSDPPPQVGREESKERKVKISGEVLLDSDKEDMVDKVDGGKVNISIPLK